LVMGGMVNGDTSLVADELEVGDTAVINGDLWYRATTGADIPEDVVTGMTIFAPYPEAIEPAVRRARGMSEAEAGAAAGVFGAMLILIKIMAILIAVIILAQVFPKNMTKIVQKSYDQFWINLLIGLAFMFVVPLVSLLLMATLIGSFVAVFLMALWLMAIVLAVPMASIHFGSLLFKLAKRQKTYAVSLGSAVVGSLVLQSLVLLPLIGLLLALVFVSLSLGSGLCYWQKAVMKVEKNKV